MLEPLRRLSERVPPLRDPEPPSTVTMRSVSRFLLVRGWVTLPMSLALVVVYLVLGEVALGGLLVSALIAVYAAMFAGVAGAFEEWGYAVAGAISVLATLFYGGWLLRGWEATGVLLFGLLAVGAALGGFAGYTESRRLQHGPFVE